MIIAVHDGIFHTDDVFAVAILRLLYPGSVIIRTRNEHLLKQADMRVDVGRSYNPITNDYDHHQDNYVRDNGIPYASAGLIWKHFGHRLVNSSEAFDYIDKKMMQPIDADDNGIDICDARIAPYTIQCIIRTFFQEKADPGYEKSFGDAVDFATKLLKKEIETANSLKKARAYIESLLDISKGYIVFEMPPPDFKNLLLDYPEILYAVYRHPTGKWSSEACRKRKNSFELRKPFPAEWSDLGAEALAGLTGVKDAIFCHRNLFIVKAGSKEGAIRLTELALKGAISAPPMEIVTSSIPATY